MEESFIHFISFDNSFIKIFFGSYTLNLSYFFNTENKVQIPNLIDLKDEAYRVETFLENNPKMAQAQTRQFFNPAKTSRLEWMNPVFNQLKSQTNPPTESRPLKPPRSWRNYVNKQQSADDD